MMTKQTILSGKSVEPDSGRVIAELTARPEDKIISHWEIERLIGCERAAARYTTVMTRVRKDLLHDGRVLLNVRGEGYRLATADEQVEHGEGRMRKGVKRVAIGLVEIETADDKKLSPEVKKAKDHHMLQARTLVAFMKSETKSLRFTPRRTAALPR